MEHVSENAHSLDLIEHLSVDLLHIRRAVKIDQVICLQITENTFHVASNCSTGCVPHWSGGELQ